MSSISMKWNRKMTARPALQKRKNILKLINLYREKRVLWDRSVARYDDCRARKAAWKDIGSRLLCNADEVRQKMRTLISTYEHERKKEMCPFCCRRDPREVYRSRWFAYHSFDFLWNLKPRYRRFAGYDSDEHSENEHENHRNAVFIKEEPIAFEPEGTDYDDDTDSTSAADQTVAKRITNETESGEGDPLDYGMHFLAEVVHASPPKIPVRRITVIKRTRPPSNDGDHTADAASPAPIVDECSTFADHVRTKLEKFDGPNRSVIMHRINSAIFDAEMRKYGRRDGVRSQPASVPTNLRSVGARPIPIKCTWIKPVVRLPKLD